MDHRRMRYAIRNIIHEFIFPTENCLVISMSLNIAENSLDLELQDLQIISKEHKILALIVSCFTNDESSAVWFSPTLEHFQWDSLALLTFIVFVISLLTQPGALWDLNRNFQVWRLNPLSHSVLGRCETYENISPYQIANSLLKDTILQFRESQVKAWTSAKYQKLKVKYQKLLNKLG